MLCLCTPVLANTEPVSLGLIEVTASRAMVASEKVSTQYTVTSEEMTARGIRTLDEAIDLVPGLNVRTGADGTPRIDMRGLRTRQVKLLVNGIPFNAAGDGQFDPTLIPTSQIEEIRVITGGASVLYGEGGTAGVINVITKRGNGKTSGLVDLRVGEGKERRAAGHITGGTDAFDWFVGVDMQRRDDFSLPSDFNATTLQGDGKRLNSDRRYNNLNSNFSWKVSPALQIALNLNAGYGERGKPPATLNASTDPFAQQSRVERIEDIEQQSTQLAADWSLTDATRLKTWVYANRLSQDEKRYDNAALALLASTTQSGGFSKSSKTTVTGLHGQLEHQLTQQSVISLALDTRRESFSDIGVIRDVLIAGNGGGGGGGGGRGGAGGGGTTTYGLRNLSLSADTYVDSAAAEYTVKPNEVSGIIVGAGWVQQRRDVGATESAPIASIAAHYDLNRSLTLRGVLAQKVRAPSVTQLYDAATGNASLQMEKGKTAEIGASWKLGNVTYVDATVFHSRIRNFIQADDVSGRSENREKYRLNGLEFNVRTALNKLLNVGAGYTYLNGRDESPGATLNELQYRPEHKISLNAQYQFLPSSWLSVSVLHVRDQVYFSRTGPARTQTLPSYTLTDVQASYAITGSAAQVYVGARNLFDKLFSTSYGFPQAGRTVYTGMRIAF